MKLAISATLITLGLCAPVKGQFIINACNDCTDGVAGGTCTDITLNTDGCTDASGTQCWKPSAGAVTDSRVTFFNSGGCTGASHRADQCKVQTDGYCVAAGTESFSFMG